ncbi:MAG: hypothetical protein ABIJ21_01260 [Nanoarchaeota archaeon]
MELFDLISYYWKMDIGATIAVVGCMKSGKTEQLMLAIRRCEVAQYPYHYFTQVYDLERRDTNKTSTDNASPEQTSSGQVSIDHGKIPIKEQFFQNTSDLASVIYQGSRQIIGVNDVQFADDPIIAYAEERARQGDIVILAGLDKTSEGGPFPLRKQGGGRDDLSDKTMYHLIGQSHEVIKLHAVCTYTEQGSRCDNPAFYTAFLGQEKGIIKTGSLDYAPRCLQHK